MKQHEWVVAVAYNVSEEDIRQSLLGGASRVLDVNDIRPPVHTVCWVCEAPLGEIELGSECPGEPDAWGPGGVPIRGGDAA